MSDTTSQRNPASQPPRASVVMTVYRDMRFLDSAVDSILAQEFSDFELIIVDDGNDEPAIFGALARRDPRIRIVVNPVNMGTAAAANRGIEHADADIILRLDCDDIAEPGHIGKLIAALDEDPQLGLVGSAVTMIDESDREIAVQPMPESDVEIRWTILFQNPFFHSAVAYRRSVFEAAGRYIPTELVSQDHYLWFHMLALCRARNLAEPLTRYRQNSRGLIATHFNKNPRGRTHSIRAALWRDIGLTYDLHDDKLARDVSAFLRGFGIQPPARRAAAYRTILKVLRAFLGSPRPLRQPRDAGAERRLRRSVIARMGASPPPGRTQRLALLCGCLPIDASATTRAAGAWLALALRMRLRKIWGKRPS